MDEYLNQAGEVIGPHDEVPGPAPEPKPAPELEESPDQADVEAEPEPEREVLSSLEVQGHPEPGEDDMAVPEGADAPITDEELIALYDTQAATEGLLSTYGGRPLAEGPPPQIEGDIELTGVPERYVIVRTRNRGHVIDGKWQRLPSYEAILERIRAEREAGETGTLFYGASIIASWGDGPPARV